MLAILGMIVSHVTIVTITFGHLSIDRTKQFLETSTVGCTNETFNSQVSIDPRLISILTADTEFLGYIQNDALVSDEIDSNSGTFPNNLFSITYMYYSLIGTLITVFVGITVSLLTFSKDDRYDPKLIHPFVYNIAKCFPGHEKLFTDKTEKENNKNIKTHVKPIEQHTNEAFESNEDETGKAQNIR